MNALSIKELRELAKRHGWRGVVVLAFDDASIAATSYGRNREDCAKMGALLDEIHDDLTSGAVQVWERKVKSES